MISAPESEHQIHHLVAENKHAREVAGSNPVGVDNKYSKDFVGKQEQLSGSHDCHCMHPAVLESIVVTCC